MIVVFAFILGSVVTLAGGYACFKLIMKVTLPEDSISFREDDD